MNRTLLPLSILSSVAVVAYALSRLTEGAVALLIGVLIGVAICIPGYVVLFTLLRHKEAGKERERKSQNGWQDYPYQPPMLLMPPQQQHMGYEIPTMYKAYTAEEERPEW